LDFLKLQDFFSIVEELPKTKSQAFIKNLAQTEKLSIFLSSGRER